MDQLIELGVFSAKALVIVISVIATLLVAAALKMKKKLTPDIQIKNLNKAWKQTTEFIESQILSKKELKAKKKAVKKAAKTALKNQATSFVLSFKGDIQAKSVKQLREEISTILRLAKPTDDVILKLESPGGLVHGYGLAAAQLLRLKEQNIPLTVCVDKVAASGGYMMACTGAKILAAPFAILGSIGVLAQIPNFHKILKKNDVDYFELTAGEYKRTLTMFGESSEKKIAKQKEQITHIHDLFKTFVSNNRPTLNMNQVATGEYWFGTRAKELGLADDIMTSDTLIQNKLKTHKVLEVSTHERKNIIEKITQSSAQALEDRLSSIIAALRFPLG